MLGSSQWLCLILLFGRLGRILHASQFIIRLDFSSRSVYDRGKGVQVWACSRWIFHPDYTERHLQKGVPLFIFGYRVALDDALRVSLRIGAGRCLSKTGRSSIPTAMAASAEDQRSVKATVQNSLCHMTDLRRNSNSRANLGNPDLAMD